MAKINGIDLFYNQEMICIWNKSIVLELYELHF